MRQETDGHKSALTSHIGQYQFLFMPLQFGNAPRIFQRTMNVISSLIKAQLPSCNQMTSSSFHNLQMNLSNMFTQYGSGGTEKASRGTWKNSSSPERKWTTWDMWYYRSIVTRFPGNGRPLRLQTPPNCNGADIILDFMQYVPTVLFQLCTNCCCNYQQVEKDNPNNSTTCRLRRWTLSNVTPESHSCTASACITLHGALFIVRHWRLQRTEWLFADPVSAKGTKETTRILVPNN